MDRFVAVGTWVAEQAKTCTCGANAEMATYYGHEPRCGLEPVEDMGSEQAARSEADRLNRCDRCEKVGDTSIFTKCRTCGPVPLCDQCATRHLAEMEEDDRA